MGVAVNAAWGAIFLGCGASEVEQAGGLARGRGSAPRQLVEAASSATRRRAGQSAAVAREGFLAGMNEILLIGGFLALAGSAIALLVREREIEREPLAAPEPVPEPAPARSADPRAGSSAGPGV